MRKRPPIGLGAHQYTDEYLADFWDYVDQSAGPDRCWIWMGKVGSAGHGYHGEGGCYFSARQIAHDTSHGPVLWGNSICSWCGLSVCVNPEHLREGTSDFRARETRWHCRQMGSFGNKQREAVRASDKPWYLIAEDLGVAPGVIWEILYGRPKWRIKPERVGGKIPEKRAAPPPPVRRTSGWLV